MFVLADSINQLLGSRNTSLIGTAAHASPLLLSPRLGCSRLHGETKVGKSVPVTE